MIHQVGVKIRLKRDILDSPGRTILGFLKRRSRFYKDCRVGKYIELSIDAASGEKALQEAQKAADTLRNPLTETIDFELLK